MQKPFPKREAVATSRLGSRSVMVRSVLAVAVVAACASSAQAITRSATYTVTNKLKPGIGAVQVGISVGEGPPKFVPVDVGAADSPATIASSVAKAVGNGATVAGNKVTVPLRTPGDKLINVSVTTNPLVAITVNFEEFSLGPSPAGILYFASNPDSGRDTLEGNALISAGFASGLAPVSFTASAGESLTDLTSTLNAALRSAGYVTRLLDSHDIELFANGAADPTEVDFSVTPTGTTGDDDIVYGVQTGVVPEPETCALMLAGLGMLGLAARRRSPGRRLRRIR